MKIGILTYQWSHNYGAALQCYALQQFLMTAGYAVEVIPIDKSLDNPFLKQWIGKTPISTLIKWKRRYTEHKFRQFRKTRFCYGKTPPGSVSKIINHKWCYDAVVVGSDQVWNVLFEKTPDEQRLFFLDFLPAATIRISYAASMGGTTLSKNLYATLVSYLRRFKAISLREISGVDTVRKLGLPAVWMPDPTLLLTASEWSDRLPLNEVKKPKSPEPILVYQLEWPTSVNLDWVATTLAENSQTSEIVKPYPHIHLFQRGNPMYTPIEWMAAIRRTACLVTNSFHGVVFSILFHRPFIVVPITGEFQGMNERLYSLLDKLNLQGHILTSQDPQEVLRIARLTTDWKTVDRELNEWRHVAHDFLTQNLKLQDNP